MDYRTRVRVCNARTALLFWAVVVHGYVCNAIRYGVRGQRYDTPIATVHSTKERGLHVA